MSKFPPLVKRDLGAKLPPGVITTDDPARLLVRAARYRQPSLSLPNGQKFLWPGGTEGIRISGQATIAEHRYMGDNKLVVQVVHRDARRIVLSGMFTGHTAAGNVRELLDVILAEQPPTGKLLSVPGVFLRQQKVAVADYEFDHPEEDRTDSFTYTITFSYLGVGNKEKAVKTITPKASINPTSTTKPERGKSERIFKTRDGAKTLRSVAATVYGNGNRWREIYNKNRKILDSLNVSLHILPTKTLPVGLSLRY